MRCALPRHAGSGRRQRLRGAPGPRRRPQARPVRRRPVRRAPPAAARAGPGEAGAPTGCAATAASRCRLGDEHAASPTAADATATNDTHLRTTTPDSVLDARNLAADAGQNAEPLAWRAVFHPAGARPPSIARVRTSGQGMPLGARTKECSRWALPAVAKVSAPPRRARRGASGQTAVMPELPEVQALAAFLDEHLAGHAVAAATPVAIQALKTYDPPLSALEGQVVGGVTRHGKFIDFQRRRRAPGAASGARRLGALAGGAADGAAPAGQGPAGAAGAHGGAGRQRHRRDGVRHEEGAGRLRRARSGRRAGHRAPGHRPAVGGVHRRGAGRAAERRAPPDQGRPARSERAGRHRQRLLRRDPARRPHVPVQARREADRRRRSRTCTR